MGPAEDMENTTKKGAPALAEAKVAEAKVEEAKVEEANIDDANIDDANIDDANIDDANIDEANVGDTNVEDTNVEDTNVEDTNVEDTNVEDTNVEDTNVEDTNVEDTNVEDTNVEEAREDVVGAENNPAATTVKFSVESPAAKVVRPTRHAPSSRIRTNVDQAQPQKWTDEDTEPVTSSSSIPPMSTQELFQIDDAIGSPEYRAQVAKTSYPCRLIAKDNNVLYDGPGCKIDLVVDTHLSFIKISIEVTDKREQYREDVVSGSYLRIPYLALREGLEVTHISETTTARGAPINVLQMVIPLRTSWLGIQNILVPDSRKELDKLKSWLQEACEKEDTKTFKLYVQVDIYGEVRPFIEGLLAVDEGMRQYDSQFLERWCKPGNRVSRFLIQHNEFIAADDRIPVVSFERRTTFHLLDEYLIFMCIGDLEEYEKAVAETAMHRGQAQMYLMHMPGQPADNPRMYLGLIQVRAEAPRLRPGDRVYVMDGDQEDRETAICAMVTLPIPGIPLEFTTVYLPMPWDKESLTFTTGFLNIAVDQVLPLPTDLRELTSEQIKEQGESVEISMEVEFSDKAYRHRVSAMARLHKLAHTSKAPTHWPDFIRLLLANNIDAITPLNVYSSIEDHGNVVAAAVKTLNDDQKTVLEHAQKARAGVVLVKGPPGTGKSYTARALLMPLILSKKQVLVCGASNACADDNANKLDGAIREMEKWDGQFVVRVYAVETESAITLSPGQEQRPKPADARPTLMDPVNVDDEQTVTDTLVSMESALLLRNIYELQHKRVVAFVPDARVTEAGHKLSIGYRILQLLGLIPTRKQGDPTPPAARSEGADAVAALTEMYNQYKDGVDFDQEKTIEFTAAIKNVRDLVLKTATCICTTPALAIEAKVYSVCGPSVEAVVFDEAGRCTEQEVIAVTSFFPNAVLKALIGDNKQLPPLVKENGDHTFFANQYCFSLLDRLIQAGVPYVLLRTQYRMVPDISRVISKFGYRGQLLDDASVSHGKRPAAEVIRDWNKQHFNRERCLVFLNLAPLGVPTQVIANGSRHNEAFVAVGMDLAKKVMDTSPGASVAILTGYNAQSRLFLFAKLKLERQDPKYSKLVVTTFDAAQGEEYDITIVDLLVTNRSAGFLNSPARLNVGFSRARLGMYVIGDKLANTSCKSRSVARMQSEILQVGTEFKVKQLPANPYITGEECAQVIAEAPAEGFADDDADVSVADDGANDGADGNNAAW